MIFYIGDLDPQTRSEILEYEKEGLAEVLSFHQNPEPLNLIRVPAHWGWWMDELPVSHLKEKGISLLHRQSLNTTRFIQKPLLSLERNSLTSIHYKGQHMALTGLCFFLFFSFFDKIFFF